MAEKHNGAPPLPRAKLTELLRLIGDSDSVELKLVVPMDSQRAAFRRLHLDPIEAVPRQVFFFDTPDLDLNKAGLVVRARRTQGGGGDTVVKLRPIDPAGVDRALRHSESFKVEVDVLPGGFVCSASFKGRCTAQEVLEAVRGDQPLRSLFSKEQRAFYTRHAPAGIKLDDLRTFGPTFVLKTKLRPKEFDRRLSLELWLFPDGSRNVEISAKSLPVEAFQAAAELRAYLAGCGIRAVVGQQTKTKAAMEFFLPEVRAASRAVRKKAGSRRGKAARSASRPRAARGAAGKDAATAAPAAARTGAPGEV